MISLFHLLWIIPISGIIGAVATTLYFAAQIEESEIFNDDREFYD